MQLSTEAFGGAKAILAAGGGSHTAVVTLDGALWVWGDGCWGKVSSLLFLRE